MDISIFVNLLIVATLAVIVFWNIPCSLFFGMLQFLYIIDFSSEGIAAFPFTAFTAYFTMNIFFNKVYRLKKSISSCIPFHKNMPNFNIGIIKLNFVMLSEFSLCSSTILLTFPILSYPSVVSYSMLFCLFLGCSLLVTAMHCV